MPWSFRKPSSSPRVPNPQHLAQFGAGQVAGAVSSRASASTTRRLSSASEPNRAAKSSGMGTITFLATGYMAPALSAKYRIRHFYS